MKNIADAFLLSKNNIDFYKHLAFERSMRVEKDLFLQLNKIEN